MEWVTVNGTYFTGAYSEGILYCEFVLIRLVTKSAVNLLGERFADTSQTGAASKIIVQMGNTESPRTAH